MNPWLVLSHCDRVQLDPSVVFLGAGRFEREVAELGIATEVVPAGRLRRPSATLGAIRKVAAVLHHRRPDLVLNWSAKAQLYGSPAATIAGMGGHAVWWQHQIPEGHWVDRIATLLPTLAVGCSSSASQKAQASLSPRRRSFVVNPGSKPSRGAMGTGPISGMNSEFLPSASWSASSVACSTGRDRIVSSPPWPTCAAAATTSMVSWSAVTHYDLSPEYTAELERLVPRLGLSDFVTMTGQVPDSRPYFELMDVAVNASEQEPFGIVLLEAMACRVPVVAVGRGGPLDIVEPGVSGVLAGSGEPRSLADAMDTLLSDSGRRAAMAIEGQRRCRERFTARLMADRLTAKLTEIANG